jgi:hypothetical protein
MSDNNDELQRLTQERRDLERKYIESERHNAELTNLWVASNRLHESLDRKEVLAAIQEIVINLVGSEELAVFETSEDGTTLELVDSFGVDKEKLARVPVGAGTIGKVAEEGQSVEGGDGGLTACVPLMLGPNAVGVVAVFKLLPQKDGVKQIDRDLFELLRTQAGMALRCTRLIRKRSQVP